MRKMILSYRDKTDIQNRGFTYDTTRMLRNAAMLGPSHPTQMHGRCTVMMKRPSVCLSASSSYLSAEIR